MSCLGAFGGIGFVTAVTAPKEPKTAEQMAKQASRGWPLVSVDFTSAPSVGRQWPASSKSLDHLAPISVLNVGSRLSLHGYIVMDHLFQ
jgi:hypothetical protein